MCVENNGGHSNRNRKKRKTQRHEAFMKGCPKQITRETTAMAKATATTTTEAVTTIRK